MKKNRMMRLASILLVCVLLSTSVISGTFAKYVSSATGSDTAKVAAWDIQLKAGDAAAVKMQYTNSVNFNLFDTIMDSNGTSVESDIAGASLIAPGTSGSFSFTIENNSEVTAEYELHYTLTESDDDIPIEFSTNGIDWVTDISDLNVEFDDTELAVGSDAVPVKVQWRWSFENGISSNEKDTALGLIGNDTVEVDISIVAQQVD